MTRSRRLGLFAAVPFLAVAGYLLMLGFVAKAPFAGLWAGAPFIAIATGLFCRGRSAIQRRQEPGSACAIPVAQADRGLRAGRRGRAAGLRTGGTESRGKRNGTAG